MQGTELRNAEVPAEKSAVVAESTAPDDDDDDMEDEGDELEANPWSPVLRMLEPHLPQLGAFLYQKFVEFVQRKAPTNAVTQSTVSASPVDVAVPAPVDEPVVENGKSAPAAPAAPPPMETPSPPTVAPTEPTEAPRNVPPLPTPEQFAHLFAIRERLSPKERAIAEGAIARMEPEMLAHWLGQLSAMSLDEATTTIRAMVAQLRASNTRAQERQP
jgi:hypothetical protein